MERARFTEERLVALLFLFFALESLLGKRGPKAHGLAFPQAMLSHIVTGAFMHPDKTWCLYDGSLGSRARRKHSGGERGQIE